MSSTSPPCSTDNVAKQEETEVSKDILHQKTSTIVVNQVKNEFDLNQQSQSDIAEEKSDMNVLNPPTTLNPEAIPFVSATAMINEFVSSGNESDDENETTVTSGK